MSGVKAKLKDIQKHLKAEEYDEVIELGKQVLKEEKGATQNVYHALVFAGVAYSKLERYDESEKVYTRAIELFPDLPLARQGLQKLYTDREEWEKLVKMLQGMTITAVESQSAGDVAKYLQKLLEVREKQELPKETHRLLDLLLPSSPLYNLLNHLDPPDTSSATTDSGASSYTPWQVPSFPPPPTIHDLPLSQPLPSSSLTFSVPPKPPSPMPAINQMIHHSDTSLALLLTLTLEQEHGEREREEKEVGIRRKRLGAGSESQVRRTVARDFLCESRMPEYYEEILSHPATPDDVRRSAESRLLRHWYRLMTCLSRNAPEAKIADEGEPKQFPQNLFDPPVKDITPPSKESIRSKIEELIQGMILLKVEDESAWATTLEWMDVTSLDGYTLGFLHEYSLLFPSSPYTTLITGYLRYFDLPEPNDEVTEKIRAKKRERRKAKKDSGKKGKKDAAPEVESKEDEVSAEDALKTEENKRKEPYTVLINGIESLPKSLFGHKILSEAYLREADYANVIATAEKGKSLIKALDIETGLKFHGSTTFLDILLGTALVHYYAPKHHPRALKLLNGVLDQYPDSVPCYIGRGYVFAGEQRWAEASVEFEKVIELEEKKRGPGSLVEEGKPAGSVWSPLETEAKEQQGWCLVKQGRLEEGKAILDGVSEVFDADTTRGEDSARVWWRKGIADWEMGGEHRDNAYEAFVTSLRHFDSFASSFTAMGVWYLDHADPPDEDRASKCFQKAFELDATQGDAARRLAEGYAKEAEWALVNMISKRVMEGEGGLEGGLSGGSSGTAGKFLPTNAWAWKASGAVQMEYKKYDLAAQAFQVALRSGPEDPILWARLGEAYAKAGKQVASLKALYQALEIAPDMWMCYYHIGNVQQQLGAYGQAILSYERILQHRPQEAGVVLACSEAWLALGKAESTMGLRERAYHSSLHSLERVATIIPSTDLYRRTSWKIFADACLNVVSCVSDEDDLSEALATIQPVLDHLQEVDTGKTATVPDVVDVGALIKSQTFGRRDMLKTAIAAFAYRADLLKYDTKIAELPLYDLACAAHLLATELIAIDPKHSQIAACQKAAIIAIRNALDVDASSPTLWNAFGVIAASASAQLAQHAYVISLQLEPKNAQVWCNYGYLCLTQNDHDLANRAFSKAQVIEPENAWAWLGQALVAYRDNDTKEALSLFEQASTLSAGNLLPSGLGYAALLFAPSVTTATTLDNAVLHEPSFALSRYCEDRPYDTSALLLHALILERLGLVEPAIRRVSQAVKVLESRYETDESSEVERQYVVALVNLGRLQLANGDNEAAAATLGDCMGLGSDRTDDEGLAILVQCHLATALSQSNREQADEALESFQKSLEVAEKLSVVSKREVCKEKISVLLARTLWHFGVDEAKEAAKTNLLEAFSSENHTIEAMTALASLGVLTKDDGIVEAVLAEIDERGIDQPDPEGSLAYLRSLVKLSKNDIVGAKRVLSSAVHRDATDVKTKLRLGNFGLSFGDSSTAIGLTRGLIELKQDLSVEDTAATLRLESLARQMKGDEQALRIAQKAIKLEPWNRDNWLAARTCAPKGDEAIEEISK